MTWIASIRSSQPAQRDDRPQADLRVLRRQCLLVHIRQRTLTPIVRSSNLDDTQGRAATAARRSRWATVPVPTMGGRMDYQPLGRSTLLVPRLGLGAMTWGQAAGLARLHPAKTAYGGAEGTTEEQGAFEASIAAGVTLFDTAAMYAGGASERRLGEFAPGTEAIIATKFPPRIRATEADLPSALDASLARLGTSSVDLYQHHFPSRRVDIGASWASWPTRWRPAGCVPSESATTRPRRCASRTPPWPSAACRWRRSRCSTHCCTANPRRTACSRPAVSWGRP